MRSPVTARSVDAEDAGGVAEEPLVLDQGVAELDQHLPARAALTEILGAMGGGVEVELGMPPHEGNHLVHPRPAAEASDNGQLWEVDGDLVEMARVAEVVGPIRRVVHGGVDAHGNVELGGLGIERVAAPIAGGDAVHEGGDPKGLEL